MVKEQQQSMNPIPYSHRFESIISDTIWWETSGRKDGAYTNDPVDAGGETKWGISKRANPDVDIKNLTYKDAVKIYYVRYWSPYYELIPHDALAFKVFDMGVLSGVKTSVKYLQKSINKFKKIRVDGKYGPLTATAVAVICGEGNGDKLYEILVQKFRDRTTRIILIKPWNIKYRNGWLRRINHKHISHPIPAAKQGIIPDSQAQPKPAEKIVRKPKRVVKK